jgi:transcriptional regulator with XRE-family HTH domain
MRRMMQGVSQEALAARIGVTFQQIQKYEQGQNRIGASRLFQLAQALSAPIGYFFEGLPDDRAEAPVIEPDVIQSLTSPEGMQLHMAFQKLRGSQTRRKVVELLTAMAEDQAPA